MAGSDQTPCRNTTSLYETPSSLPSHGALSREIPRQSGGPSSVGLAPPKGCGGPGVSLGRIWPELSRLPVRARLLGELQGAPGLAEDPSGAIAARRQHPRPRRVGGAAARAEGGEEHGGGTAGEGRLWEVSRHAQGPEEAEDGGARRVPVGVDCDPGVAPDRPQIGPRPTPESMPDRPEFGHKPTPNPSRPQIDPNRSTPNQTHFFPSPDRPQTEPRPTPTRPKWTPDRPQVSLSISGTRRDMEYCPRGGRGQIKRTTSNTR